MLIISGRDLSAAERQLELIREKIAAYPMRLRSGGRISGPKLWRSERRSDQQIKVTVSIGLAQRGKEFRGPDTVLKAADQALYKAKRGGRNRVSVRA
ncbi:diguanylate cyclase [Microbulbifer sp. MLAF003]|uniref:GGDEF domain-containing protein n=1 Tax=Microbulbifer sp. MLAF003 TaxID=3032582 RepID=UPI00333EADCF